METQAKKSLNLEQFIAKSKQRAEDRMKYSNVYIESYDMEFPLVKLGFNKVSELLDEVGTSSERAIMANKELVYLSMPSLQTDKLHKEHTLTEPWDIVYEVFTSNEVNAILKNIFAMNGVDMGVEEVKNS